MYQVNDWSGVGAGDIEQGLYRRLHPIGFKGLAAITAYGLLTVAYFAYRIPLWNPQAPILSGLMLAAELFGVLTLGLHVFSTWTLVERVAPPVPAGFDADIFITTWNESTEILRHTLLAAKQVKHARQIWLLDDGCRPEMEELARALQVRYLSRTDRSHAKAGNLNNALKHSDASFVAIFDCDHAPSPEFLERTLGHFVDPGVAFVQTPQDFYNVDSFQHRGTAQSREAWHEQTLFYRVIQAGKDRWNATFFCGSCAIMRRAALDDIGGFATGTITEDMHTSLRFHKNGWRAVYHAEALAFGLSPANLEQYDTQRLRWGRGAMQVWTREGILLRGGKMNLAQRLCYFTSAVTYFEGWQKAVVYFLPMIVLLTGKMPIIWTGWPFVEIFAAWLLAGLVVNEVFSRGYAKTIWMEEYNFLRFFTFIKATLALVIPIKWGFSVTPKTMNSDFRLVFRLWPQVLVTLGAIGSILIGGAIYRSHHHLPEGAFIANMIWLTINGGLAIKSLSFVTLRMRQRRSGHRFPLPIVARVTSAGGPFRASIVAVAQDVSSDGLNLSLDRKVDFGLSIEGTLLLPSGPLPFRGTVLRNITTDTGAMLGVRFDWASEGEADRLNRCLYGNTLQWDVNNWAEVRRIKPWRMLPSWLVPEAYDESWELARVSHGGDRIDCLVKRDGPTYRILSYAALPATSGLCLRLVNGDAVADLQVTGYRQYELDGGFVHLAALATEALNLEGFHREPMWAHG
ncbi:MAG TPA: glycosyltransferase [Novosphingobium sp.]|nr:glycosyltransferase [Novosphingobium sp.]